MSYQEEILYTDSESKNVKDQKTSDICFPVIFGYYDQSLVAGREAEH